VCGRMVRTDEHAEGLHDLKLEESLAPTREALSSAIAAGSSSLFKAFDGVRNEVATRMQEAEKARRERQAAGANSPSPSASSSQTDNGNGGNPQLANISATVGGIGRGIGSFFGSRVASFRGNSGSTGTGSGAGAGAVGGASSGKGEKVPESPKGLRPISLSSSASSGSLKLSSSAGAGSTANPGSAGSAVGPGGSGGPGSAGMTGLGKTSPKTIPKVSTGGLDAPRGLRPMTLAAGRSVSGSGR
jgi:hypothetical protein